jgi:hypothetical protein
VTPRALALVPPPGILHVEGDVRFGPQGTLRVPITGAGEVGVLDVTGAVGLDGTLELQFENGFAPQAGDVLTFLTAGGEVTGHFAAVTVTGLAPGFDFDVSVANGALVLTARTSAAPLGCLDPGDGDGDGSACADDCPFLANADQADTDGDRAGDACDPCLHGTAVVKPKLTIRKGTLVFSGGLSFGSGPVLHPEASGARLVVRDQSGKPVLDLVAPPGAFDPTTKRGWKKLAFANKAGPVTALRLTQSKRKPTTIGFTVKALAGTLDLATLGAPSATLTLDATTPTDVCGEVGFTGPPGIDPVCTLKHGALGCADRKRPRR